MSKKRRVFDIDMPEEETIPTGKVGDDEPELETKSMFGLKPKRRGPMASAITENADSLKERQAAEQQIRAENDHLAHEYVQRKADGLVIDLIALDDILTEKLARDRADVEDEDLSELIGSIQEIGLSNPIRVQKRDDGRFELVQGFRRLSAYKALSADSDVYATIPATVIFTEEDLETLYRKMVDENLVRKDISFAEMASLAIKYANDGATDCNDADKAVAILFKSAGYQKRSYIRSFIGLMERVGGMIKFPAEISRALGLELRKRIDADASVVTLLENDLLAAGPDRLAEEEQAILRRAAGLEVDKKPFPVGKTGQKSPRKAKTVFNIARPEGTVKCTATAGKLELRLAKDFSTVDRVRLEQAIRQLLAQID
ncbi:replication protein [Amylibacter sp. SFDW26]|uniref:ParB/RepB/Spo0J family partition protein n=1 Tax=Amylibacter sp. SFDW26 TaxID=2652722 RepID=UPI0012616DC1|nr:ParB N-terminal domain-containing protein [Amylibacter sp. SFDW26]KAB7610089.1 replication protein [Amylibacter sp. SFDW26]